MLIRFLLIAATTLLAGAPHAPAEAVAPAAAPLAWIEIPAKDTARARKFYQAVFGWTFTPFPAYGYDAWRIKTGSPGVEGAITSQIYTVKAKGVVVFMRVKDIETALSQAVSLGATIERTRTPLPGGAGSTVVILDPDKNAIGLIGPPARKR
jgi:uncharacterized protein